MGLTGKIKDAPEGGGDVKRFTGVCPVRVVRINPNAEQLKSLGISVQKEPEYTGSKDGVKTLRLDFWLNNPDAEYIDTDGTRKRTNFLTKIAFFIEDKDYASQSGLKMIINKYAQSTRSKDIDTLKANDRMSWFSQSGIRYGKVGEAELLTLLQTWLGLSKGFKDKEADECVLDTSWSKLVSGDVSELQRYVDEATLKGRGIKALFGVEEKNGKLYQTAYMKCILSGTSNKYDSLIKALNEPYGEFKADYQDSFDFKLYNPANAAVKPDTQGTEAGNSANKAPISPF